VHAERLHQIVDADHRENLTPSKSTKNTTCQIVSSPLTSMTDPTSRAAQNTLRPEAAGNASKGVSLTGDSPPDHLAALPRACRAGEGQAGSAHTLAR
jgi:hypothetical protein